MIGNREPMWSEGAVAVEADIAVMQTILPERQRLRFGDLDE